MRRPRTWVVVTRATPEFVALQCTIPSARRREFNSHYRPADPEPAIRLRISNDLRIQLGLPRCNLSSLVNPFLMTSLWGSVIRVKETLSLANCTVYPPKAVLLMSLASPTSFLPSHVALGTSPINHESGRGNGIARPSSIPPFQRCFFVRPPVLCLASDATLAIFHFGRQVLLPRGPAARSGRRRACSG